MLGGEEGNTQSLWQVVEAHRHADVAGKADVNAEVDQPLFAWAWKQHRDHGDSKSMTKSMVEKTCLPKFRIISPASANISQIPHCIIGEKNTTSQIKPTLRYEQIESVTKALSHINDSFYGKIYNFDTFYDL